MNDIERYRFDLQGYLVVENALSDEQLGELNRALDRQKPWAPDSFQPDDVYKYAIVSPTKLHVGFLIHRDPAFLDLIDNPVIVPYLAELIGDRFRLDHEYAILMKESAEELRLHGGGEPYNPHSYYVFKNGRMFNGLLVVSYALTDVNPGDGGFCCIPGSHTANFPVPAELKTIDASNPMLIHVPLKAGSAVIFTEALTHGTMPWKRATERRSLLYKYSPGHQTWMAECRPEVPKAALSERRRRILEAPYVGRRSSVLDSEPKAAPPSY